MLCCVQWHLHFQLNLAIGEYASIKFKYPLGSFFFIFIFWNAFVVVEFDEWLVCHVDDGIRFRYYALTWNLNMIFVSVFCFCLPPHSGLCDLMASRVCVIDSIVVLPFVWLNVNDNIIQLDVQCTYRLRKRYVLPISHEESHDSWETQHQPYRSLSAQFLFAAVFFSKSQRFFHLGFFLIPHLYLLLGTKMCARVCVYVCR